MKRVMVGALTLALMLGAVGCGEKKNDNASLIGDADVLEPEEIIVTPQGVPEETTHEYYDVKSNEEKRV